MNYGNYYFFKILDTEKRELFDLVSKNGGIKRSVYFVYLKLFKELTRKDECDEIDSISGDSNRKYVIKTKKKNTLYHNSKYDKYIICEKIREIFKSRERKCIKKYSFYDNWSKSTRMFDKIKNI